MAKVAFDKIKAGLDDVVAYLDGSGDKSHYSIGEFPRDNAAAPSEEGATESAPRKKSNKI